MGQPILAAAGFQPVLPLSQAKEDVKKTKAWLAADERGLKRIGLSAFICVMRSSAAQSVFLDFFSKACAHSQSVKMEVNL